MLYCSCGRLAIASRWRWSEVKTYEVSKIAFDRGYGTPDEVSSQLDDQPRHPVGARAYAVGCDGACGGRRTC